MRLTFVQPLRELRPFIESFWVFESDSGLPAADASIAAPNGCAKLVIPYRNSLLSCHPGERTQETKEHGLYFVGVQQSPTFLTSSPRETGFIVVEFSPQGACRFLDVSMAETTDGLFPFEDLRARIGREMREALCNLEGVDQKVRFVQDRLTGLLRSGRRSSGVVDYAVATLRATGGQTTIKALGRQTGYSNRYLEILFKEQVGLSPKALARIFRFQRLYEGWARGQGYDSLKHQSYDYYHDQSHFAKEFKQFTGYPPRRFADEISNEFGRRLALK